MKSIFYISIFFFFSLFLNAQVGGKDSPLKLIIVHVPDSLKIQLLKITYLNDSDLTVNSGLYIHNLKDNKDTLYKDGLYEFYGFGPHFPKRIFIVKKSKFYIFSKLVFFDPKEVYAEFLKCSEYLDLNNSEFIQYANSISKYLKTEESKTYGTDIKKKHNPAL